MQFKLWDVIGAYYQIESLFWSASIIGTILLLTRLTSIIAASSLTTFLVVWVRLRLDRTLERIEKSRSGVPFSMVIGLLLLVGGGALLAPKNRRCGM